MRNSSDFCRKGGKEGDHRHRMTEQEEDEELLTDLNQSKKSVLSFDESPHYIKHGKMRDYQGCDFRTLGKYAAEIYLSPY